MKLGINCGEQHIEVEISGDSERPKLSIGGREIECDWVRLSDGHSSLIIDGRVFDVIVEAADSSYLISGREGKCRLQVRDPRAREVRSQVEEGAVGLQRLHAEMPGKIIRVLVDAGDVVAYDQALLVVEAMKMQNEIRAPKAGTIREVAVAEGMTVNSGEFLLSVD